MQLSRAQFDQHLSRGTLKIAFIGMSNIGKSYLSKILETTASFTRIDVDKAIEAALGLGSMDAMAAWLGYPYENKHSANAKTYLRLEGEISLAPASVQENSVLDTTGSIIHLPAQDQQDIKNQFLMVYLEASQDDLSMLQERYFRHPKPTIWAEALIDKLRQHVVGSKDKSKNDALLHYYPQLLQHRAKLYRQLSDVTIPAAQFTNASKDPSCIIGHIRAALPA